MWRWSRSLQFPKHPAENRKNSNFTGSDAKRMVDYPPKEKAQIGPCIETSVCLPSSQWAQYE